MTHSLMQPTDSAPPNPFVGLLRSRKFWLMVLDVVVSTVLYFAVQQAGANLDNIKFLIAAYQPVFVMVIHSITEEDKARTRANAEMQVARTEALSALDVTAAQIGLEGPKQPRSP